jgi:hypothetical protein
MHGARSGGKMMACGSSVPAHYSHSLGMQPLEGHATNNGKAFVRRQKSVQISPIFRKSLGVKPRGTPDKLKRARDLSALLSGSRQSRVDVMEERHASAEEVVCKVIKSLHLAAALQTFSVH